MLIVLTVLPLLGPEIPIAIPLRPLNPGLNLLAAEESGLARFVVRDAVEIELVSDEFNLRVTRNHPSQFVDVNPVFLRAEGGVQGWFSLECKPLVDDFQLPDDSGKDLRNHCHTDLLYVVKFAGAAFVCTKAVARVLYCLLESHNGILRWWLLSLSRIKKKKKPILTYNCIRVH